jgi:hypothetical protein
LFAFTLVRAKPTGFAKFVGHPALSGRPAFHIFKRQTSSKDMRPRKTKSRQPLITEQKALRRHRGSQRAKPAHRDHASETHHLSERQTGDTQAIKIVLALTGYIDSV